MIDTSFLKQLGKFSVILKKRIYSNYSGSRQSRKFGSGLVFYDYRPYSPGDDFRAIDWRVYGRTDELFIRRFEEERNLCVHTIIDTSASMDYGAKTKKFEYGAMLALGFGYMAIKNNERFEISSFADDLNVFRTHKGMGKLISNIDALNKIKPGGHTKFSESLEKYKSAIKTKSLIIIISDFLFSTEEIKKILPRFRKSEVICIQVLDSEELNPLLEGDLMLEDSETKDVMRTFVSNRFKENYSKELGQHINEIKQICDTLNVKFVTVSTETPIFDAFYNILAR